MSAIATKQINRAHNDLGELIRLPTSQSRSEQRILVVEFVSAGGRTWRAIGGGETVAAAIADAQESCPNDITWQPFGWNDLYGD